LVAIPGSEMLTSILHIISQSLILPITIALLIFITYAIIEMGGLIAEYSGRTKTNIDEIEGIINSVSNPGTPETINGIVEKSNLPKNHKEILYKISNSVDLGESSREALARKLIENEEIKAAKSLEKTDIIAKVGPAVGLIGTLVPLGPGLAALGAGDIQSLAQHLTVAFDAAIIGLASAGIGFIISKVRRRWYEEQLSTLDTLAESILEALKNVKKTS